MWVNIFVFHAVWVRLNLDFNTLAFGHFVNFSGKKVTASPHPLRSEAARTPVVLAVPECQETDGQESKKKKKNQDNENGGYDVKWFQPPQ